MSSPWKTTEEAAPYVRRSPSNLEKLRTYGGGPRYSKQRGKVLYHTSDLDEWLRSASFASTSEQEAA
jgi:hypothetical protein